MIIKSQKYQHQLCNALDYIRYNVIVMVSDIIERFLARNRIKYGTETVYTDNQNVHNSSINKSITVSIYKLLDAYNPSILNYETMCDEITNDTILNTITIKLLFEFMSDDSVHSVANVTFKDVLQSVWGVIKNHKDSQEIKTILNTEMNDSMCKCFTGRLSRLINTLNGFTDIVEITISETEQISNVIITLRKGGVSKEKARLELVSRGYSTEELDEWLEYYPDYPDYPDY